MSDAETLRRAAAEIRSDWNGRYGGGWQKVVTFNLAVADLLDICAGVTEPDDDPNEEGLRQALAVAHAYLQESP